MQTFAIPMTIEHTDGRVEDGVQQVRLCEPCLEAALSNLVRKDPTDAAHLAFMLGWSRYYPAHECEEAPGDERECACSCLS